MNIHFIILHLYLMHFLCVSVIFHSRKKCLKSNLILSYFGPVLTHRKWGVKNMLLLFHRQLNGLLIFIWWTHTQNLCFVILVVSCLRAGTASHASWVGGGGTKCATCPAGQEPGGWSSGPVQWRAECWVLEGTVCHTVEHHFPPQCRAKWQMLHQWESVLVGLGSVWMKHVQAFAVQQFAATHRTPLCWGTESGLILWQRHGSVA